MNYESKNEWYLTSVKLKHKRENGAIYYEAIYSNGLITQIIAYRLTDFIYTILKNI